MEAVGTNHSAAIFERVLPYQKQRGRLGQTIGTEIGSGIDRLLGNIEQQAAAGTLRPHDFYRGLRHALVAIKIQLKTLAQHRLVDLADPTLPGGAGIRHRDVDPAKSATAFPQSILDRSAAVDAPSKP